MQGKDTYGLMRMIASRRDLSPAEKSVAFVLALGMSQDRGHTRLRRDTIAAQSGVSGGHLGQVLQALEAKGVIHRKRTGRATIYGFLGSGKNPGRVDRLPAVNLSDRPQSIDLYDGPMDREHMRELEKAKACREADEWPR